MEDGFHDNKLQPKLLSKTLVKCRHFSTFFGLNNLSTHCLCRLEICVNRLCGLPVCASSPYRINSLLSFVRLLVHMADSPVRLSSSLPLPSNVSAWEEAMKKRKNPFIIGVCGGTASGKTSVCEDILIIRMSLLRIKNQFHWRKQYILKKLENKRVAIVSQDSFYASLTEDQIKSVSKHNFDHPGTSVILKLNQTCP